MLTCSGAAGELTIVPGSRLQLSPLRSWVKPDEERLRPYHPVSHVVGRERKAPLYEADTLIRSLSWVSIDSRSAFW